jgi:hypothetical protein
MSISPSLQSEPPTRGRRAGRRGRPGSRRGAVRDHRALVEAVDAVADAGDEPRSWSITITPAPTRRATLRTRSIIASDSTSLIPLVGSSSSRNRGPSPRRAPARGGGSCRSRARSPAGRAAPTTRPRRATHRGRCAARVARRVGGERGDRDVLAHGERPEQPQVLERADEARPRDPVRRRAGEHVVAERAPTRTVAGTMPVIALTRVVLPAPFGPMRPRISPLRASIVAASSARKPPKSTTIASARRRTSGGSERARARPVRGRGSVATGAAPTSISRSSSSPFGRRIMNPSIETPSTIVGNPPGTTSRSPWCRG